MQLTVLWLAVVLFFFVIFAILKYDPFSNIMYDLTQVKFISIYMYIGFDSVSLLFIYLTCFFIPLCILFMWKSNFIHKTSYMLLLFSLELTIIAVFLILDILLFYIMFEMILIPFFILVGISGVRVRRVHASYLLFFYTMFGSILMLVSIFNMYSHCGTTNMLLVWGLQMDESIEFWIFIPFIISFSIKVPVFPFHIWLPEAHVESPTEGSVILAAILLKVGLYGFLRILLPVFSFSISYYANIIFMLNIFSIVYTSFITLRQIDIKKIIAYSSVGHMNICVLGMCTLHPIPIVGSILLMFGHGFVSAGLFFLVGILYDRYKTKLILYYSGVTQLMPIFSFFFFFFIISNISIPGTSNFVGELLVIYYIANKLNWFLVFFFLLANFICSVYSIWVQNKVLFGIPKYKFFVYIKDINLIEFSTIVPVTFMILWVGIYPNTFIDLLSFNIYQYYLFTNK